MTVLAPEPQMRMIMIGCVQAYFSPPKSNTRRAIRIVRLMKKAPGKSMRFSFVKVPWTLSSCFEAMRNLHWTRIKATRVMGN